MKKLLTTLALTVVCLGAFPQGKITFINDTLHLVYFSAPSIWLKSADAVFAGQAIPTSLPSGTVLIADPYGGTSSTALSLYSSMTVATAGEGGIAQVTTTEPPPALRAARRRFSRFKSVNKAMRQPPFQISTGDILGIPTSSRPLPVGQSPITVS